MNLKIVDQFQVPEPRASASGQTLRRLADARGFGISIKDDTAKPAE
jgi:hypothetical protein